MTESQGLARMRIFQAGEFEAPKDWPGDVGIAVVVPPGAGPEVFPVHRRETGQAALRRIAGLSGIDLSGAAVHPPVAGLPDWDLSFSALRDLLSDVEGFLLRNKEAVEEAEDFAINFEFAAEEGIPLAGVTGGPAQAPEGSGVAERPDGREPGLPRGYAPVPPVDPVNSCFRKAVLRIDVAGGRCIVLDPSVPAKAVADREVLMREDGLSVALPLRALEGHGLDFDAIRLPRHCLPLPGPGIARDIPLAVAESRGYLLFTPVPAGSAIPAAEPAPSIPAATPRPQKATGRNARSRGIPALLATALVAVLGVVLLLVDPAEEPRVETSVDALRTDLFQ